MDPHVHLSGLDGLITFAWVVAFLGVANLLARKFPNNPVSQAWLYVFSPGAVQHNGN
jgi:hypothetical protein